MVTLNKVFDMVQDVQKHRPGWRFSLLGGDVNYAYRRNKAGKILGVLKKKKVLFGWQAEFFGGINPMTNTGDRHASSGFYVNMNDAILIACAQAIKAIREGAPQ